MIFQTTSFLIAVIFYSMTTIVNNQCKGKCKGNTALQEDTHASQKKIVLSLQI